MGIIDRIAPEIEMTKIRYKKTEDKTPNFLRWVSCKKRSRT